MVRYFFGRFNEAQESYYCKSSIFYQQLHRLDLDKKTKNGDRGNGPELVLDLKASPISHSKPEIKPNIEMMVHV